MELQNNSKSCTVRYCRACSSDDCKRSRTDRIAVLEPSYNIVMNMKNELPAMRSNDMMVFVHLGENEDIDMTLDRNSNLMTFERVTFNDESGDWEGDEVYLEEVQEELEGYAFLTIAEKPLNLRELSAMFSHRMVAVY